MKYLVILLLFATTALANNNPGSIFIIDASTTPIQSVDANQIPAYFNSFGNVFEVTSKQLQDAGITINQNIPINFHFADSSQPTTCHNFTVSEEISRIYYLGPNDCFVQN